MAATVRAALVRLAAGVTLAGIVIGLPVALVVFIGWPLPHAVPTRADLTGWLTTPLSDTVILDALAVAAWLLWAAFLPAVLVEVRAARLGLATAATTGHSHNPLQFAAAALVTALTIGALPSVATPAVGDQGRTTTSISATWRPVAASTGAATLHVGDRRYAYVVARGDTLSRIAGAWLGDAARWPEICRLNWHRHWPDVGGSLTDCDLIYPGWDLRLPDDATPPPTARPVPADGGGPPRTATSASSPVPTTPPPATPTPSPTMSRAAEPTPITATPTNAVDRTPDPAVAAPPSSAPTSSQDGVTIPRGFLPWSLAAALAAAVALVWLQRRRRHVPGSLDDDPGDLPEPLLQVTREVARRPDLSPGPSSGDLAERAAAVPEQVLPPPGGLGLVGDGAAAAARAALVTVLASGGPRDPDHQGEVIIDGATLSTLIGAEAAALGPWPRMHVADDLENALALLDTRLLHRARLLDEHDVTTVGALRERAPDEEPLPPVLLVTELPPPGVRMRLKTALGLGADAGITALLLGQWPHTPTVGVEADGRVHPVESESMPDGVPARIAVLDTDATVAALATLREAHTGHRTSPATTPAPAPDDEPLPTTPNATRTDELDAIEPVVGLDRAAAPVVKARLRVFGEIHVEDVTAPGKPLRAKAAEVAVFLACHPRGVDTHTIGENLEPGVRRRSADVRVHTNVSNLRHVLGRAAGPRRTGYVVKPGGRYRLDPATVEVDLWQLCDLITQAAATSDSQERVRILRQACDLYTAPLADGCDYDWVEPHRERARQQAIDAHTLLAEALLADDPQGAADILDRAIRHDPYSENLYRQAMRARAALGDQDGVQALLRSLTIALADLDVEPDDETIDLARSIRAGAREPRTPGHSNATRGE